MERWKFSKNSPTDKIWWASPIEDVCGIFAISADKKIVYNLYSQLEEIPEDIYSQFCKENPFWENYFSDRRKVNDKE